METKQSFGQWVKQRRKALDMTQHALAQRIGCALSTIQKIEIDARQPSYQMAELLAEHLELASDERAPFLHLARHQTNATTPVLPVIPPPHVPSHNLPTPLTALVGREWEVVTVRASLLRPEVRLLTITGPPGIGKTRLSLQVATELQTSFADGVYFVALAPISDATFVVATIVRALGIKDAGHQPPPALLKAYLSHKQLLLVLDNFEHVLLAAPLIAELLEAAPYLKVLVTSRALLHLYGEHEFVTPLLTLPDLNHLSALDNLTRYAAVDLFVQRARAAKLDFAMTSENAPLVAELCVHLEGLPLAIELAAARSKMLTPEALLARLAQPAGAHGAQLRLLVGNARNLSPRQQTLRNAIAWSYDLLNPTEQRIFRALGVFAGDCPLDALQTMVSTDLATDSQRFMSQLAHQPHRSEPWLLNTVQALVNQNLVIQLVDDDGAPCFTLLEMMREYALEQLEQQGEAELVGRAHAAYFFGLAGSFVTAYREQNAMEILRALEVEVDNLRVALRWAQANDLELALQLISFMITFWCALPRYLSEGRHWLEATLPRIKPEYTPRYADILGALGFITWQQGDFTQAQTWLEESIALYRQLQEQHKLGKALQFLALTLGWQGDYAAARTPAEESIAIFRGLGEPGPLAEALGALGNVMCGNGDYTTARQRHEECLLLYRQLDDTWGISLGLLGLSEGYFAQGDDRRTRACLEEALQNYRALEETWFVAQTLLSLGKVVWRQGDKPQATALWAENIQVSRTVGAKEYLSGSLLMLGWAAQEQGDPQQAKALFTESLVIYQVMEHKTGAAYALSALAGLLEQTEQAAKVLGAAATVLDTARKRLDQIERTHYEQIVASVRARLDEATFAEAWAAGRAMTLEQAATALSS